VILESLTVVAFVHTPWFSVVFVVKTADRQTGLSPPANTRPRKFALCTNPPAANPA